MDRPPKPFSQRLLPYLTRLSHMSEPFITTFILIHLTAPVMANLGGASLASQTMLLGREYYQTPFAEKYLVLGPIVVHALAGFGKRLLSPSKTPPRPLRSILSITGYTLSLFLLPVHFFTHRVYPKTPSPPISSLGPSQLDFEFVKYGLTTWPIRSWLLYGALITFVAAHAVDGIAIMWNTYFASMMGRITQSTRKQRMIGVGCVVVLPVLSGLFFLSKEPLWVFGDMAGRFDAVFKEHMIYRI